MQKKIDGYKIVLKRDGRKKRPFYRILVLTKSNRYRYYLGSLDMFTEKSLSNIYINKLMLFYWISKGAYCSDKVSSILNYLLIKNK